MNEQGFAQVAVAAGAATAAAAASGFFVVAVFCVGVRSIKPLADIIRATASEGIAPMLNQWAARSFFKVVTGGSSMGS